jgi:hypothetical protein
LPARRNGGPPLTVIGTFVCEGSLGARPPRGLLEPSVTALAASMEAQGNRPLKRLGAIDPRGEIIVGPLRAKEEIIVAKASSDFLRAAKVARPAPTIWLEKLVDVSRRLSLPE